MAFMNKLGSELTDSEDKLSKTLGIKLQIMIRANGFLIYRTLKLIHDCTVHRGQYLVKK
jgi:hypothetical protein